ncbi:hypothetical protein PV518_37600, partial [Streptomyces sp. ND04-05B]|uniref:hypothetical protein n=1 Tax=Streptomyces sp. ND04-05B TaxID=3028693 RepID=UPI0029B571E3|nr:hypothetical protein [Streptomyces sp. ND04-05B]
MRILMLLPFYGQAHALPTGAFITSREYARGLVASGHDVHVVMTAHTTGRPRVEDGVHTWPASHWWRAIQAHKPELLISHHGDPRAARMTAAAGRVPHLLMVHGMTANRNLGRPALAWFPSNACREHYPHGGPSLVLAPPVDPEAYRTLPGDMVTLSGSSVAKGADVLREVAQ